MADVRAALLRGRHDEVDDDLVRTLGGEPAACVLSGGEGGKEGGRYPHRRERLTAANTHATASRSPTQCRYAWAHTESIR